MSLFREKIPVAEHKEALEQATAQSRTALVAMAAVAKVEGAEEKTDKELVEAITGALNATVTLADENNALEAQIKKAEEVNGSLTEKLADAATEAKAAKEQVEGITALFGEKAKAQDFDLVKAVGDIAPEAFTAAVQTQRVASNVAADIRTPADDLAAELAAGKITNAEFYKKSMALLESTD